MGWLSRIRWTRAARAAGIAAGAIAAFATVVALGDAPPPRLADDIGVRMTAPAAVRARRRTFPPAGGGRRPRPRDRHRLRPRAGPHVGRPAREGADRARKA